MNNTSLAGQAAANGPRTIAQPSFESIGWLVVTTLR